MGGGQPRSDDPDVRTKRIAGVFEEDESKQLRKSHENPFITQIYDEFLEFPNSHVSHELLHTHYVKRGRFNEYTDEKFVIDGVKPMVKGKKTDNAVTVKHGVPSENTNHEEPASESVLALEAENRRLKNELQDALETVEIFKQVIADYTGKPKPI